MKTNLPLKLNHLINILAVDGAENELSYRASKLHNVEPETRPCL
jgi:hypothetical protein